ncbi:glucosidase [Spirosoma sp. SC4-14]|uniref:MGH1-like glycoside hydrolase domain-containing protein n=1 Tax=Spirosoma sp. SC4-14 TaxID=3128900 RepID=UPI0030D06229
MTAEQIRLQNPAWRQWGSYVSDRQWGTVREDYSPNGDHWSYTTHSMARSYAYRWGEEGIAGFCDNKQQLCLALALWNGQDSMLKERYFGLSNPEGNHGEDVKEVYFYLDATPTHSYQKLLYKYPQRAFPYEQLVDENAQRSLQVGEFELLDTGIFDDDRYFDVFVEYAKADPQDILMRITVWNRGPEAAPIHLLPTLWFRNTWRWNNTPNAQRPILRAQPGGSVQINHSDLGQYVIYADGCPHWLFCENETNVERLYASDNTTPYPKDGINDYLLHGLQTVNPEQKGTKTVAQYKRMIEAGSSTTIQIRLRSENIKLPFNDFDDILQQRKQEADEFYAAIHPAKATDNEKYIQRLALSGMIWNKQFYYYNIWRWLNGDPGQPSPPPERWNGRNHTWLHLINEDIIAMPDKWEYPWYAAWDLAFHSVTFALIDPEFAKNQLLLLTNEWCMNPDGQLPSFEGTFSDVNPPVHAWAAYRIVQIEQQQGQKNADLGFLRTMFEKLMLNFTWWVNRKDHSGNNIFAGGFLGLDNIGVFDRDTSLPNGEHLEQADATSWMGMFALNMMRIALELSQHHEGYTDLAIKFFDHFLFIQRSINQMGKGPQGLWDKEDAFFYDQIRNNNGEVKKLRVRTLVGLFPLYGVEALDEHLLSSAFLDRIHWFEQHRPSWSDLINHYLSPATQPIGQPSKRLLSLVDEAQFKALMVRMLDETEFLSGHGIRSVSRVYRDHPYEFSLSDMQLEFRYAPAESDIHIAAGNSNWRGPVWMPVNYLMVDRLLHYYQYYGNDFRIECPVGSGQMRNLKEIAQELTHRLIALFIPDANGQRPIAGSHPKWQDEHFKPYPQFYEYFNGDNGQGLGASHQTGWTGLVADLIRRKYTDLKKN